MAEIKYYPKEPSIADRDKPRIWFSCHLNDFDKWFNIICKDICSCRDSIILYKDKPDEFVDDVKNENFWSGINLLVVLLSENLINSPGSAVHSEIRYAKENKVKVLPICVKHFENLLDEKFFYQKVNEQFGSLHCDIKNVEKDRNKYKEDLAEDLNRFFVDPEMIQKIKEAFAAYIFLSYRKMDRDLAIELIKLIKEIDELWDVAVWFDDYLTPGEDFNDGIAEALEKSKIFNLLVTPRLLEPNDKGEPNYVVDKEYPMAEKHPEKKVILPAEMEKMEKTDKDKLRRMFDNIPECVNPQDDTFKDILKNTLLNNEENKEEVSQEDASKHKFLIGLAYMLGIDSLKDHDRAAEYITPEAERGNFEAIDKVEELYLEGNKNLEDLVKQLRWAQFNVRKERFEKEKNLSELHDLCKYVTRSMNIENYEKEINELECYLAEVSKENCAYRREFADFYKSLAEKSEKDSLTDFLKYYNKYAEQLRVLEEETDFTDEDLLEELSLVYNNLCVLCSEKLGGYIEDILKGIPEADDPEVRRQYVNMLSQKADEFGKLTVDYYEKVAQLPEIESLFIRRLIFNSANLAGDLPNIKEYCFEKSFSGLRIKEERFGLEDDEIELRNKIINKINRKLELKKNKKKNKKKRK